MNFFVPIIEKLNNADVRYVVVGGLAVVLQGHNRLTGDIDIVIDLEQSNCLKAINLLTENGFMPRVPVKASEFADATKRGEWINEKGMTVFSMFLKANPICGIDLFVEYPLPFDRLFKNSELKTLGEIKVRVASIDDLIEMKTKVARPKDLEDITALNIFKNLHSKNDK